MAKKNTASTTPVTAPTPARRRGRTAEPAAANDSSRVADGRSASGPSPGEIAEAAYHRYLSRGASHGGDFDDWLEAERDLRTRRSQ